MIRVIPFLLLNSFSFAVDQICSSACDITHSQDDSCFQSSIAFFENSLVVSLRNYVDVQTRLQRIRAMYGEPLLSTDEMVDRSINNMKRAPFRILEDEVCTLDDARTVATELAKSVQTTSPDLVLPGVECPEGCEKSSTLWMGLFLASLALNLVLLVMAVTAVLYITYRNEQKARLLLTKSLEREKKKLNEKGRQPIQRSNSVDEIVPAKPTLDPKKWEKRGSRVTTGTENGAYEGDQF